MTEPKRGSTNIPLTTNLISLLISKLFGLPIKEGKIKKKIIWCKYVYTETCLLNF